MRKPTLLLVALLLAAPVAADCPPMIAFEYCQVGCEALGNWVAVGVQSPETARAALDPLQRQTASVVRVTGGQTEYVLVVREMADAPVELPAWGWQWRTYGGLNAVLHAAVDARTDGGTVVTTADGTVVRLWWMPCSDARQTRPTRR